MSKHVRIATLDGIYIKDINTGFYEPVEPEPELHPRLILAIWTFLYIAGWSAVIGLAYCAYRAVQAVAS